MKDIMIDIETFGTGSNSIIVSISAVNFDISTGAIGDKFEVGIDLKEQIRSGAHIDVDTVVWWLGQPKEAQEELLKIERIDVKTALELLNAWILNIDYPNKDMKLWGNGATFDNVIVRNLYRRENIEFPLPFWCDNDVRTLVNLSDLNLKSYAFEGTKHNGTDERD